MRLNRWWITDAVGHRVEAYAQPVPATVTIGEVEFPVIEGPRPDPEDWVCDYCAQPIPYATTDTETGETRPMLVPMIGTSALCPTCMAAVSHEEGARSPYEQGWTLTDWSADVCACPPCRVMASRMLAGEWA